MPLPEKPYPVAITLPCKSSSDCRIKFDSNIYSVPSRYSDNVLTLKATAHQVFIYYKTKLISTHRRSYGKGKVIENLAHVRELLRRKRKAIASKIIDEFISLGEEGGQYLEGLLTRDFRKERERICKRIKRIECIDTKILVRQLFI